MVVARDDQHTAVRVRACHIAMLERVARAVDARPFAVPEREDAILRRIGDARQHLRSPDRGRREIFVDARSEEHTSELQSLMRISYAVFCLKKKNTYKKIDALYHDSRRTN